MTNSTKILSVEFTFFIFTGAGGLIYLGRGRIDFPGICAFYDA